MRPMLLLLCLLSLTAAVAADLYTATSTGPATLQLPVFGQANAKPRVFWRAGTGKWQPAVVDATGGRLVFKLDPAKLGSSEVMLLVNPPAGLVLDDFDAPRLTALKIDGKDRKVERVMDLGALATAPRQIVARFGDAANALQAKSWRATLDDAPWPGKVGVATPNPKQLALTLPLAQLEYGPHEISLSVADGSPQSNAAQYLVRFNYIDSANLALASLGATVKVDSCFAGYESLTPLNDGNTTLPGTSCGNDVTWASTETPTDHWAEVTLAKPAAIKEVSLYWAAYTDVSHTAQQFEIQIPDGAGWKAVYSSPAGGEKPSRVTTARFAPVTVSKFRVFMPAGKGSETRPNLLWLAEIKAR